ncbi:PAS domain-containing protein [bacterium]|nr:PAS domain-containing protein [bacterium]
MSEKLKISTELETLKVRDKASAAPLAPPSPDLENLGEALSALSDNHALAFLFDSIVEGVALIRAKDGRLEWANRAFLEAIGEDLESVQSQDCEQRWSGAQGNCKQCPVSRSLETGQVEENVLVDGRGRSWRVRGIPILENGELTSAIELREDVTRLAHLSGELKRARKEFEERLDHQAEETRKLIEERELVLDKTSEFAYRHDETGVFHYLSPSVERITGYSLEEWSQHYCRYLTDHPDNDWVVQATERTLRTGEKSDPYLVEIYHKNGTRMTLEVDEEPVLEDELVTGIVGVARDVTDRVLSERIRKEAHRSLQIILDSIPLSVFWKDCDSRYLGCNHQFAKDAGKSCPDEVVGLTDFDMIWGAKAEYYRGEDFECMESGEGFFDREVQVSAPGGREAWLRSSKIPLYDSSGTVVGVLGTYENISAIREARLESRNQILDLLEEKTRNLVDIRDQVSRRKKHSSEANPKQNINVAQLNQELSMPLDGAINLIGQRLQGEAPDLVRDELQDAFSSAKSLAGVLGDLMRISDTDVKDQKLDSHPFNLEALFSEVIDLLRTRAGQKNLELELDCASRLPRRVHGDRIRLRQVLLNLLGNAVRYTDEGWVRLEVDRSDTNSDLIRILVRDSGQGIKNSRMAHILDHEHGKGYAGGLPTSQKLVLRMGGSLKVESETGQGTVVCFELPLPSRDPLRAVAEESLEMMSTDRVTRQRILLVGGGSESRSNLRSTLEHEHCDVEDTGSYHRGEELMRFGLFDAVLLDCDADREKALRSAGRMIEKEKGSGASLIVGLCEGATTSLKKSCVQAGMIDVLDRQLERADLSKLLGKLLETE